MRFVSPVSGDLLVKLLLAAGVISAGVYFARRVLGGLPSLPSLPSLSDVLDKVNPASPNNVVYSGISEGLSDAPGIAREETVGGLLNEMFDPAVAAVREMIEGGMPATWSTGGGQWNNPSAYSSPGVTGDGGAAFGIYPRP